MNYFNNVTPKCPKSPTHFRTSKSNGGDIFDANTDEIKHLNLGKIHNDLNFTVKSKDGNTNTNIFISNPRFENSFNVLRGDVDCKGEAMWLCAKLKSTCGNIEEENIENIVEIKNKNTGEVLVDVIVQVKKDFKYVISYDVKKSGNEGDGRRRRRLLQHGSGGGSS